MIHAHMNEFGNASAHIGRGADLNYERKTDKCGRKEQMENIKSVMSRQLKSIAKMH